MATQPWITPQDVRGYTDNPLVSSRSDDKLIFDIARAEAYVITYTRNSFADDEKYPVAPDGVKLAVILLAEYYAAVAVQAQTSAGSTAGIKSESFDDYSYTAGTTSEAITDLNLGPLLDQYIIAESGRVNLSLRRL